MMTAGDPKPTQADGPKRSFGQSNALYARAQRTIPQATQTFSKSAISFVLGASPLFLDRGDGCRVWDVDGNEYVDYVLGLLPVILGYRDPDVDGAIRAQLERGITFSLATELEADLAERLVRLIPCAEMVRFGKNGSDATSAAVRLARAYTGRDRVAVCGYHGWHDWYIGTTTRDLGVPEPVGDLSCTFPFNDADALEDLLKKEPAAFAAVILEPDGTTPPHEGFLQRLRALTEEYGVVLIFDEIVTGFRMHMGGAQAAHGVTPDVACFGKAMANGMPIAAVLGRREIMIWMDRIFFSTTFGGETLSLAAAIATIDKLEKLDVVSTIHKTGRRLAKGVTSILVRRGLADRYVIRGPDWRPIVAFVDKSVPAAVGVSLLRQELIENGLLMGSGFNICMAHDATAVDVTLERWAHAADTLADAFECADPASRIRGEPVGTVFQVRKE